MAQTQAAPKRGREDVQVKPERVRPGEQGESGADRSVLQGGRASAPTASMLLIRRFEEKAGQLYGMGQIGGFCHLYIGQEAVVVGLQMAMKEGDQVITGYRDHGHMLATGMDPKGVMAELTGRRSGYSRGKGGSMHMFSKEKQFLRRARHRRRAWCRSAPASPSPTSIARTATSRSPISATAPPIRVRSTRASTWRSSGALPVVYVIENNQYAHGHQREARLGHDRSLEARPLLRHSRRAGGRHGRARREGGRRHGARARALRQGSVHPRNAHLPLSRPFDVRPGEIPRARRKCRRCATSTTRSSRCGSGWKRRAGRARTR